MDSLWTGHKKTAVVKWLNFHDNGSFFNPLSMAHYETRKNEFRIK